MNRSGLEERGAKGKAFIIVSEVENHFWGLAYEGDGDRVIKKGSTRKVSSTYGLWALLALRAA